MTTIYLTKVNCPKRDISKVFERFELIDVDKLLDLIQVIIDWELFKQQVLITQLFI